MLGLRITLNGSRTVTAALSEEIQFVSAGANLTTGAANRWDHDSDPPSYFHCTGMDDRDDHLRWFLIGRLRTGASIEIEVAEVPKGDAPLLVIRKKIDWGRFFARMAKQDSRRLKELKKRLTLVRSGIPHVARWKESRPPLHGLLISVNGKSMARIGVGNPGTLSVDVHGRRRDSRTQFTLTVHGGERLGERVWRSFRWPWSEHRLKVGDWVRIEVVPPRRLQPPKVREVSVTEPCTEAEILTAIERLDGLPAQRWYENEAAMMITHAKTRPPPRRYRSTATPSRHPR